MLKPAIPPRKPIFPRPATKGSAECEESSAPGSAELSLDSNGSVSLKKKRDNQHSDRFIEVGTKALRRETDVWGDAAGTAPAVTSVTNLAPSIYFQSTINNGRAIKARPLFLEQAESRERLALFKRAAKNRCTPNLAQIRTEEFLNSNA